MIAAIPLTLLMVMAIEALSHLPLLVPRDVRRWVLAVGPIVWVLGFGVPFAINASTNLEQTNLPPVDDWHYFQSPYNTFGYLDTFDWLRENAEPDENGMYHLITVGWMCDKVLVPYGVDDISMSCPLYWHSPELHVQQDHFEHATFIETVLAYKQFHPDVPLYLSIDHEHDFIPDPYPSCAVELELLDTLQRPKGGQPISIWKIEVNTLFRRDCARIFG